MRDKEYKLKSYRLDDKTIEKLEDLKLAENLSYNLLFKRLIEKYGDEVMSKMPRK